MVMAAGIMLAKTLAPENLGKFFSDQALVLLGTGLINLGIGHGYRQIVSRRPELRDSYLLPVVFVRIAAMVLYLGALSAYLHYVGRWNLPTVLVVVGTLAFNLLELYQIDLQISRRYSRVAVLILSRGLVLLGGWRC
jgi:O-antigen/teichoic acid export membrane protein